MEIIVVDSDRAALENTAALLRDRHPAARVHPMDDGMEAVRYAYSHPVDALYTEVLIPRITGFDVARLIRRFRPETREYVVTRTADYLDRARREGLAGYYLKDGAGTGTDLMREAPRSGARVWRRGGAHGEEREHGREKEAETGGQPAAGRGDDHVAVGPAGPGGRFDLEDRQPKVGLRF